MSHRLGLSATVLAGVSLFTVGAIAAEPADYTFSRSFNLPAANAASGGTVLFDALPDGRLLTLNGTEIAVESGVGTGVFDVVGSIPGFGLAFGPSFLRVSPDGTKAAAGSNGLGSVVVFDPLNPSAVTTYAVQDYDAVWIDNTSLAIANATTSTGVEVLNTSTGSVTSIISNIGGASAGVAIDAVGNLYTGNGFDFVPGGSETGWIKAFPFAQWQAALSSGTPINFESAGIPVVDLLSAASLGFDQFGNFFVGGADFFGGSGDLGYAALVDADDLSAALAANASVPPIDPTAPADVLRKFVSPQATIDALQPPFWSYNDATGELYLRYFSDGSVNVYVVPEPATLSILAGASLLALRRRRRAIAAGSVGILAITSGANAAYTFDPNDFAVEVVSSTNLPGTSLYNDPAAVLGRPTLRFNNSFSPTPDFRRTKLIEPAFNTGTSGEKVITTFNIGQSVTVRMGRRVEDDPGNPFGIDFIVFGNAFFTGSGGFVSDTTDLNTFILSGGIFAENVRVSVSPDNLNWYSYATTGDGLFPTNSYVWDADTASWTDEELDPTKPVDPQLRNQSFAGLSAASVLALYDGSAGGAGFDLAESGFAWIEYVRFDGISGFAGGEIDAVADVRAIPEPATLAALGLAGVLLLRKRR